MSEVNKLLVKKIIKSLRIPDDWILEEVDYSRNGLLNKDLNLLIMRIDDDGKIKAVDKKGGVFVYLDAVEKKTSSYRTEYQLEKSVQLPLKMSWWDTLNIKWAINKQFELIKNSKERATEKAKEKKLHDFVNKNKSMSREMKLDNILEDE